jgi:hypothetical protein
MQTEIRSTTAPVAKPNLDFALMIFILKILLVFWYRRILHKHAFEAYAVTQKP